MELELTHTWQLAVVGLGFFLQLFLAFKRPERAIVGALFLLPTYLIRIRVTPLPTNILELLVIALALGFGLRLLFSPRTTPLPQWIPALWIPLSLFILGVMASAVQGGVWGGDAALSRQTLGSLKGFVLIPALFLIVFAAVVRSERSILAKAFRAYAFSALAVAAFALLFGFGAVISSCGDGTAALCEGLTFDSRLRAFYGSPNELAMYLLPAILLLVGGAMGQGRSRFRMGAFVVMIVAILWTQSLGVWAGGLAGLVFFATFRYRRRAAEWFAYTTMAMGVFFPFVMVALSGFLIREGERSSFASRVMIWRSAITLAREHWFFGIGPGLFQTHYLAFQAQFPPYLEWAVPQPHNLFLSLWLGAGFLGLLGLLGLLIGVFRRVRLQPTSSLTRALLSVVVALIVVGWVDAPFWRNDTSLIFLLVLAAALYSSADAESSSRFGWVRRTRKPGSP